jgi:hypothetical protein
VPGGSKVGRSVFTRLSLQKKANDAMISESPIPGSDRNARNKKKPVYLAHARCFLEAEEAEDFIKSMGYTVKEVRKHYMKGTDITLYVLDYFSIIQSIKNQKQ